MPFQHLSFKDLFEKEKLILEIPMLQRDYAYGRKSEYEKRKEFLVKLRQYICSDKVDHELDFIYGSVNSLNGNRVLTLLDGQQRITTLFLVYWYFALVGGKHTYNVFRELLLDESGESRFRYKTRDSSTSFCNSLVQLCNSGINLAGEKCTIDRVDFFRTEIEKYSNKCEESRALSALIFNEKWFFIHWKNDPTVYNMLNMLDSIQEIFPFNEAITLYKKLDKSGSASSITFNFLNLDDYKLTDELYIKMNSRGKPLTRFENLKSELLKELDSVSGTDRYQNYLNTINREQHSNYQNLRDYVALMLDTKWTDIFWNAWLEDNPDLAAKPTIDDMMLCFICNFSIFSEVLAKMNGVLSITVQSEIKTRIDSLMGLKNNIPYEDVLSILSANDCSALFDLIGVLDSISEKNESNEWHLKCYFGDSFYCFQEKELFKSLVYDYNNDKQNYEPKVLYFTYLLYLIKSRFMPINTRHFKEWMQFAYNVVNNSYTIKNGPHTFSTALAGFNYLFDLDIRTNLPSKDVSQVVVLDAYQLKEEVLKAKLSINHNWAQVLNKAEDDLRYFEGQLYYPLITCSNTTENDTNNTAKMGEFKSYVEKISSIFSITGCNVEKELICALLSKGDYTPYFNSSNSLLQNGGRDISWRRYLKMSIENTDPANDTRRFFTEVINDVNFNASNVVSSLKTIAANRLSSIEKWRLSLIDHPQIIDYLGADRYIRWNENSGNLHLKNSKDNYEIDLLKKKQIFGKHLELFTFVQYIKLSQGGYVVNVIESRLENVQPGLKYISKTNNQISAEVFYADNDSFDIRISSAIISKNAAKERTLLQSGFSSCDGYLVKRNVPEQNLAQELSLI